MSTKKKNFFESLLVFSVITGILLPVRLLFVSYVSDNWFGSFGIISLISIILIILTKKGKLGKFGKIFERQIEKFHRGRGAKFVYIQGVILLTILGGTIYAIEVGNSEFYELKEQVISENSELSDPKHLLQQAENIAIHEWILAIVTLGIAFFVSFPQVSVVFAILNDTFDGWVLHFYTVAFVEYLELFGILIFYRISSSAQFKRIMKKKNEKTL